MTNNEVTFWKYIQQNEIRIPKIQRDYAQGRLGEEFLRKNFLTSIKDSLDHPDNPLVLDFVYGGKRGEALIPLDGQQRLTTLWILHWYIAFKSGKLDEAKPNLSRFHYETRISSGEFIQKLCELKYKELGRGELVNYIKDQIWYRKSWDSDPTVTAILTMISGTSVKDKDGSEILDGMEELFPNSSKEEFEGYWDKLTQKRPIVFFELALDGENLPATDSLYVKMNARGKPLTDFENFKADLFNYLHKEENKEENKKEEKFVKVSSWFENAGVDLFWRHSNRKETDPGVDEVFLVFLQRYLLSEYILNSKDKAETLVSTKSFKQLNDKEFNVGRDDRPRNRYVDFSPYEELGGDVLSLNTFETMIDCLKKLSDAKSLDMIDSLCLAPWDEKDSFCFIPKYRRDSDPIVSLLTNKTRVVFSAVIIYLKNLKNLKNAEYFEKDNFKGWMRFVWNMAESFNLDGSAGMIDAVRWLNGRMNDAVRWLNGMAPCTQDRKDRKDIIAYLSSATQESDPKSKRDRQYNEEIVKAQRIKDDASGKNLILDAEKSCFFHGCIRFLFTSADGKIDWGNFETKFSNAKKIFSNKGVNEDYKKDSRLLCFFVSQCTAWSQLKGMTFGNTPKVWRDLLSDGKYAEIVDRILNDPNVIKEPNIEDLILKECEDIQKDVQRDLCNSKLMDNIIRYMNDEGHLNWRYDHYVVFPYNAKADWKKYVLADERNSVLTELMMEGKLLPEHPISDSGYFWGWDVPFSYNGEEYTWTIYDKIRRKTSGKEIREIRIENKTADGLIELLRNFDNVR